MVQWRERLKHLRLSWRSALRVLRVNCCAASRNWLVTIGRPLHARNGGALLAALEPLVERGGSVAVLGCRVPRLPENDWRLALEPETAPQDLDEGLLLASRFDHERSGRWS